MKKTLIAVLALMLSISLLAGCGAGGGTSAPEGKYNITSLEMGGQDVLALYNSMSAIAAESGAEVEELPEMYIEFRNDGKCAIVFAGEDPEEDTFTMDGNNITIGSGDTEIKGTVDGNKVTLEGDTDEGLIKVVAEKQ